MATITEDYISFETAKLLKEKGFKTPVETGYYGDGRICHNLALDFMDYNHEDGYYSRPTIQMAMKWLREVHKLWITITFHWHTVDGETTLYYSPYIMLSKYKNVVLEDKNPFKMKFLSTYEQACEAAIKYCLEYLI